MSQSVLTDKLRELVRFGVVGGSGVIANLTLLMVLVELAGVPEPVAAIGSALLVLAGSFLATNWWVFADADTATTVRGVARRGGSYYLIMLTGKAINYGLYLYLLSVGVWYPVAWVIGSAIVFVLTFLANRLLWYR